MYSMKLSLPMPCCYQCSAKSLSNSILHAVKHKRYKNIFNFSHLCSSVLTFPASDAPHLARVSYLQPRKVSADIRSQSQASHHTDIQCSHWPNEWVLGLRLVAVQFKCWHNIMCLASYGHSQESGANNSPGDCSECDVTGHCHNVNNTGCQSPRGWSAWQHKVQSNIFFAETFSTFVTRDIYLWRSVERRGSAAAATSGAGAASRRGHSSGQSRLWSRGPGGDNLLWQHDDILLQTLPCPRLCAVSPLSQNIIAMLKVRKTKYFVQMFVGI